MLENWSTEINLYLIMKFCFILVLGLLMIKKGHIRKLFKTLQQTQEQQAKGMCISRNMSVWWFTLILWKPNVMFCNYSPICHYAHFLKAKQYDLYYINSIARIIRNPFFKSNYPVEPSFHCSSSEETGRQYRSKVSIFSITTNTFDVYCLPGSSFEEQWNEGSMGNCF